MSQKTVLFGTHRWSIVVFALFLGLFFGVDLIGITQPSVAGQTVPPPPPTNDQFNNATIIDGLPFNAFVDIGGATTELDEPQPCNFSPRTVWYKFTPTANLMLRVDTAGSSFSDTTLNVYETFGPDFGGLNLVGCGSFGDNLIFNVQAGVTYYVQAGNIFGGSSILHINLQEVQPPPNDNFAAATAITALPFHDNLDTTGATLEVNEPTPSCEGMNGTAWYVFTPSISGSLTANASGSFSTIAAAYTGSSLNNLVELGCRSFSGRLTIRAIAGTPYYFQVGGFFGGTGPLQFSLDVTPPPQAGFSFSPADPSSFDNIQFFDNSSDPGDLGFQTSTWNFGDGATALGLSVNHPYAVDGNYTVQHSVTTIDGRSASTSQVIAVKTHDVAIVKFARPKSATEGETRRLIVSVENKRYPEEVEVTLYKSTPQGYQFVGTSIQYVPLRSGPGTTDFYFSYTFTPGDAQIGKVTFKTVATIRNARDVLPADNEFISFPVTVNKRSPNKPQGGNAVNSSAVTIDNLHDYVIDYTSNKAADMPIVPTDEQGNFKIFIPVVTN